MKELQDDQKDIVYYARALDYHPLILQRVQIIHDQNIEFMALLEGGMNQYEAYEYACNRDKQ